MINDWFKNKLDIDLYKALNSNPDELKIKELIQHGANINAINKIGDNLLQNIISSIEPGEDLKSIHLLIELGADLNYANEGLNCLFDAYLTRYPELVELLLKAGANPNCIGADIPQSLLDWVEFDLRVEERHEMPSAVALTKIVQLLKDYGAKGLVEIIEEIP